MRGVTPFRKCSASLLVEKMDSFHTAARNFETEYSSHTENDKSETFRIACLAENSLVRSVQHDSKLLFMLLQQCARFHESSHPFFACVGYRCLTKWVVDFLLENLFFERYGNTPKQSGDHIGSKARAQGMYTVPFLITHM